MIDIYVWTKDGIEYYTKIERCITDVIAIPAGAPPDASLISANDWHALVGEPVTDPETGTIESFEAKEAAYIAGMGWTLPDQQ